MSESLTKEELDKFLDWADRDNPFVSRYVKRLLADLERTEANLQSMIVERDHLLEGQKELEARLDRIVEEVEQPKCSYGLAGRVLGLAKGER